MQGSKDMWPATIHFLLIFGLVSPFSSTYRSNSEHWTHPTGTAKPWLVVLFAMFCCFGSYFNWGFAGLHNPLGEGFGEVAPYGFKKILSSTNAPVVYVAAHNAQFCHQRRWRSPFTSGRFTTGGAQCRSQVKFHLLQFVKNFIFMIYSICVQIWSSIVLCEETDLFEFDAAYWLVHPHSTPH